MTFSEMVKIALSDEEMIMKLANRVGDMAKALRSAGHDVSAVKSKDIRALYRKHIGSAIPAKAESAVSTAVQHKAPVAHAAAQETQAVHSAAQEAPAAHTAVQEAPHAAPQQAPQAPQAQPSNGKEYGKLFSNIKNDRSAYEARMQSNRTNKFQPNHFSGKAEQPVMNALQNQAAAPQSMGQRAAGLFNQVRPMAKPIAIGTGAGFLASQALSGGQRQQ